MCCTPAGSCSGWHSPLLFGSSQKAPKQIRMALLRGHKTCVSAPLKHAQHCTSQNGMKCLLFSLASWLNEQKFILAVLSAEDIWTTMILCIFEKMFWASDLLPRTWQLLDDIWEPVFSEMHCQAWCRQTTEWSTQPFIDYKGSVLPIFSANTVDLRDLSINEC